MSLIVFGYAPSKVIVFSWQMILYRLPTRRNLCRRGILEVESEPMCPWCSEVRELDDHLFAKCLFATHSRNSD
jgi:hypothetical protein